jgi:zinc protease
MRSRVALNGILPFFGVVLGANAFAASPAQSGARPNTPRYAIVVEKATEEDGEWKAVVSALAKKHTAEIFRWDKDGLDGMRKRLAAYRPRYVCFVARPDELARESRVKVEIQGGETKEFPLCGAYYHDAAVLMRSLNDDPYDDALWALLTGATAEDALRVVSARPLTVSRGLSHVGGGWLDSLESGVSFSECAKGEKWSKQPGKSPEKVAGPEDTTEQFVKELNSGSVDMVSTSGHATEHDWQMGFSYKNGMLVPAASIAALPEAARENYKKLRQNATAVAPGWLLGVDTANNVYGVEAANPKVYYSPGNCLIARVDGKDCMVLAWIHHGAMQFSGHVGVQSRSCYEWGLSDYFFALQGRFSFAEAVWLNRQAMRLELSQGQDDPDKYICCRNERTYFDRRRSKFLWETTVLYGDPAWEARVKPTTDPLYDQEMRARKLEGGGTELTFLVKMRRASLPSRPAAFFQDVPPPFQAEVREGPKDILVAENFVLVPFWKPGAPAPKVGDTYRAVVVLNPSPTPPAGKPQAAGPEAAKEHP